MKHNFLSKLLLVSGIVVLGYSCKKVDVPEELNGRGSTVVKLPDSPEGIAFIELKNTPQLIDAVEIRRDVASQGDLSKPMTVALTSNFDIVDALSSGLTEFPAGSYSFDAANPASGNTVTLTFAPGEFAKTVKINVPDATVLNPNNQYGLGFVITSVDGGGKKSAVLDSVAVAVTVKNKYDGKYKLNITTSGWDAYGISENLPGDYPNTTSFATTGAGSVSYFNNNTGSNLQGAFTSGNASATQFGAASPKFTFDPATDKLIDVDNALPDDGRGRDFALNPAAGPNDNYYDPATKTIHANYILKQTGRPNLVIMATWTYTGPR